MFDIKPEFIKFTEQTKTLSHNLLQESLLLLASGWYSAERVHTPTLITHLYKMSAVEPHQV